MDLDSSESNIVFINPNINLNHTFESNLNVNQKEGLVHNNLDSHYKDLLDYAMAKMDRINSLFTV